MLEQFEYNSCVTIGDSKLFVSVQIVVTLFVQLLLCVFIALTYLSLHKMRLQFSLDIYKYERQLIVSLLWQVKIKLF